MKKLLRRLLALSMAAALTVGMSAAVSAFTYPKSYWPLHDQWESISSGSDTAAILTNVQKTYDLLRPLGLSQDVCWNLEPKCAKASWICEVQGDLNGAVTWLQRQLELAQWLHDNGYGYHDTLLDGSARLTYLQAAQSPKLYALGSAASSYSYGPKQGTWLGSALGHDQPGESAALMYVTFNDGHSMDYWTGYYKNTSENFRRAVSGGVLEVAWNFSSENTAGAQAVLSADSYIADSLRTLGGLNATVLLRLGAEMNNWSDCDPAVFIQAFRKVAEAARAYGNIQMVFSPNDISNRNVTIQQFYPGDQYVDWVGMSTYHKSNYNDMYGKAQSYALSTAVGSNAFYGTGVYSYDPLVVIKPIVELAKSHNKPVMISECGFAYQDSSTGADQTAYAAEQLNKFYSYVNMVYPQVKAVFYFDVTLNGGRYSYALNDNSTVLSAYRTAIANNGGYLTDGTAGAGNWQELSAYQQKEPGTVKLAAYVSFPGVKNASVQYYVDGALKATVTQAPYYYELDTTALSAGAHKVYAVASGGQFKQQTATYTLTVPAGPPAPSAWAKALLEDADSKGLITQRTRGIYQDPITRLQFAELAVNMIEKATGKSITPAENTFHDTSDTMALKAVAAGVAAGKGEGKFAPDAAITRQEICVMLNRAIEYVDGAKGTDTLTVKNTAVDAQRFNDAASIDSWAVQSVALLTNNGLMAGQGSGVAPKANTTVEQAIVLIRALYDKF